MATKQKGKGTPNVPAQRASTDVQSVDELMKSQAAAIASRIQQPGGNKIQVLQGKQFRFPDGTTTSDPIEVVIVEFVSGNFLYDRPYKEGEIFPPACFALGTVPNDDLVPDPSSPDIQGDENHACRGCEHNLFGSKGDGKACQNRKLLAVLPPDADEDAPIMTLSVSPTAGRAFDAYAATLASVNGLPPAGVISTIAFDPRLDYSSLRFGKPIELPVERKAYFLSRQKEAMDRLMVKPDVSQYEPPKAKPAKARVPTGRR